MQRYIAFVPKYGTVLLFYSAGFKKIMQLIG